MCERLLVKQLSVYGSYHLSLINKILHYIGVPLVVFSLLIIFSWLHVKVPHGFNITLAWLLTIAALIYYFFLDYLIACALTVVFIILNLIVVAITNQQPSWVGFDVFIIAFVLGWLLLFIGHYIEKKKPAFFSNLLQLLVGPFYIAAEIFFCFGYKKAVQEKIKEAIAQRTSSET